MRRKFFELAEIAASARRARQAPSMSPLVAKNHAWMTAERVRVSKHALVAKAMDNRLTRWERITGFLQDGRIRQSTDDAEKRRSRSGPAQADDAVIGRS